MLAHISVQALHFGTAVVRDSAIVVTNNSNSSISTCMLHIGFKKKTTKKILFNFFSYFCFHRPRVMSHGCKKKRTIHRLELHWFRGKSLMGSLHRGHHDADVPDFPSLPHDLPKLETIFPNISLKYNFKKRGTWDW